MRRKDGLTPAELERRHAEARAIFEEAFVALLDSSNGDYIIQAHILEAMKPQGW